MPAMWSNQKVSGVKAGETDIAGGLELEHFILETLEVAGDLSDSTVGRMLALNMADTGLIPSIRSDA